jgi:competence protein ComEA
VNRLTTALACLLLSVPAFASTPVDINKADAVTISESLDGIGMAKAQAIVTWRDQHGPFKTVQDLAEVKGVGMSLVERNREAIQLGETAAKAKPAGGKAARKSAEASP